MELEPAGHLDALLGHQFNALICPVYGPDPLRTERSPLVLGFEAGASAS